MLTMWYPGKSSHKELYGFGFFFFLSFFAFFVLFLIVLALSFEWEGLGQPVRANLQS